MASESPQPVTIDVDEAQRVSGLPQVPARARACYVLAHGAGAGMAHPFMAAVASGLAERGISTLRYQFPYMERGSRRPDAPGLAQATVRAAVREAARRAPELALVAGGKSFGGRMTSQAQVAAPLPGVQGLAFLGFPLHPVGKPSAERAKHLFEVSVPLLFLQGTRDDLADVSLLQTLAEKLGARAALKLFDGADHSFHVPARSGRKDPEVLSVGAGAHRQARRQAGTVVPVQEVRRLGTAAGGVRRDRRIARQRGRKAPGPARRTCAARRRSAVRTDPESAVGWRAAGRGRSRDASDAGPPAGYFDHQRSGQWGVELRDQVRRVPAAGPHRARPRAPLHPQRQ